MIASHARTYSNDLHSCDIMSSTNAVNTTCPTPTVKKEALELVGKPTRKDQGIGASGRINIKKKHVPGNYHTMSSSTYTATIPSRKEEKDAALSLCSMSMMQQVPSTVASSPSTFLSNGDSSTLLESHSLSRRLIRLVSSGNNDSNAITSLSKTDDGKCNASQKNQCVTRKKRESIKREPRIPFEEMKRLMRVYGPTKCLRHRKSKIQGNANVLSVKRKFYRWFPDLEERFEKTDLGWYKPRIGHEAEMKYREELRRKDQELLTLKRVAKRESHTIFQKTCVENEMLL